MGQSLVQNYVHIVFSTKHREPFINPPFEDELHKYLVGICDNFDCTALIVGGHIDHIHILCKLSPKIALMKLLEVIKSNSSKWYKTKDKSLSNFYWQSGYGAFSVNPSQIDTVFQYIKNQKKYHQLNGFKSEYLGLMKKYKVKFNEQYVWD